MKVVLISNDKLLINMISNKTDASMDIEVYRKSNNPLDVTSFVCVAPPTVLIVDDDFLKPQSAHILKSIKRIKKNIAVIFITSDNGIELGREISQIGIHFYAIKPIEKSMLTDLIHSANKLKVKSIH